MFKEFLQITGGILLITFFSYLIYILFVPMQIGERIVNRKVIENSHQYIVSQRAALVNLNLGYEKAEEGQKEAIKAQMCEIAITIPQSEIPDSVLSKVMNCQ